MYFLNSHLINGWGPEVLQSFMLFYTVLHRLYQLALLISIHHKPLTKSLSQASRWTQAYDEPLPTKPRIVAGVELRVVPQTTRSAGPTDWPSSRVAPQTYLVGRSDLVKSDDQRSFRKCRRPAPIVGPFCRILRLRPRHRMGGLAGTVYIVFPDYPHCCQSDQLGADE